MKWPLASPGWWAAAAGLLLAAAPTVAATLDAAGARAEGARLTAMQASPNYREGRFVNALPRAEIPLVESLLRWLQGGEHTTPAADVPSQRRRAADFAQPPASGLRITWLGHSSSLIELDGRALLVDPVWGERAAPLSFVGPRRFHRPPIALEDLPPLDAVVISHDHYDHLDQGTVEALADRVPRFVVPLGVGAHLESWGVPSQRITELDWWGEFLLDDITLAAVPARHASGRSITLSDLDATLWSGWALVGPHHRVYYSGDTAMFPELEQIGERYGPFDATLIETGAYDPLWSDVHLGPEQAVLAHRMVRGSVLLPVHWGTFDLALHGWTEPVERTLAAAERAGVRVAVPRPGESLEPGLVLPARRWWPELPWRRAHEAPLVSTGLSSDLRDQVRSLSAPAP